jgi:hypothetical protein
VTGLGVLFALCLIYVGWRIATDPQWRPKAVVARWRAKHAADTQPIPPPAPDYKPPPEKTFTPLADSLAESDVFKDVDSLVAGTATPPDAPRELPHVVARKRVTALKTRANHKGKK